MDQEPKGGALLAVLAIGGMLVCCLAPILFLSGAGGIAAWLGGVDPVVATGIGVSMFVLVLVYRRLRKSGAFENRDVPTRKVLEGKE